MGLMMYDPERYGELGRGSSQQYLPGLLSLCPQDWSGQRKLEVAEMILAALRGFLIDWLASGNAAGVEAGFEALARALPAIARAVAEFLDRLDLHDVTLVGNDTGGALVQLLMGNGAARVGRVVLASCDAFDNFPPGLTGKTLVLTGKLPPPAFGLFMQQMRLRPVRRLPIAFGWLTRRGDAATARWMKPVLTQPAIRRDTVRTLRAIAADKGLLEKAAERMPGFTRPALVIWASGDRVMPPEHGRRLAELLPHARLAEVPDSYTLIPLDQPARFAQLVREFIHAPAVA
jgi:pimeloyl-ACP methyl ester carboxylesterase